jgi:hypothetical protein
LIFSDALLYLKNQKTYFEHFDQNVSANIFIVIFAKVDDLIFSKKVKRSYNTAKYSIEWAGTQTYGFGSIKT